jgi:CRP/FNR family cyclic AMP-dependent transcriptional regulator
VLDKVSLFESLDAVSLDELKTMMVTRVFPKNSIIINEGDENQSLYILESGRVKVYLSDENGREIVLSTQGPGEYFGEMALLDDATRSASVLTLEESKIRMINKADFEKILRQKPEIALGVIKDLIRRLRQSTESVRSLALMDVYGRVARLLLSLSEENNGYLTVTEKLTHQDIADRVGSSREMISRIFKDLKQGGYIEVEDKRITIKDKLPSGW